MRGIDIRSTWVANVEEEIEDSQCPHHLYLHHSQYSVGESTAVDQIHMVEEESCTKGHRIAGLSVVEPDAADAESLYEYE